MKKLRIGSIGTCRRGALADNYLTPEDNVEIVAGADISTHQLDRFKARIEERLQTTPNCYLDYREMIEKENLDGVFVTSPDFCHEEQAVFALKNRVGVYLEKPIAITLKALTVSCAPPTKTSQNWCWGTTCAICRLFLK